EVLLVKPFVTDAEASEHSASGLGVSASAQDPHRLLVVVPDVGLPDAVLPVGREGRDRDGHDRGDVGPCAAVLTPQIEPDTLRLERSGDPGRHAVPGELRSPLTRVPGVTARPFRVFELVEGTG